MMITNLQVYRLDSNQKITDFDCGDDDLNDFILNEAVLYRKELLSVSYIIIDQESNDIKTYFSLAKDRVSLSDFESKTEFNRFRRKRFVNEKRLKSYPAAKICRLAVSNDSKGLNVGSYLIKFIKSYFLMTIRQAVGS